MSTETTNKKIKIDNGTTFGRTYTDKAVDELLKNVGGGGSGSGLRIVEPTNYVKDTSGKYFSATGELPIDLPKFFILKVDTSMGASSESDKYSYFYFAFVDGRYISSSLDYVTIFNANAIMDDSGTKYNLQVYEVPDSSFDTVLVEGEDGTLPLPSNQITETALNVDLFGLLQKYALLFKAGNFERIPLFHDVTGVTDNLSYTSNIQHNADFSKFWIYYTDYKSDTEKVYIKYKDLTFKYGTLRLKNITSNSNSYTIELSFFDYIYDVIINGANKLMGTSLTRDTFPSFLKNNITPQLFTTLITNIIDVHRKGALMPYFDVTIIDQINNGIFANCSTYIEGIVVFSHGTNNIDLSNITFGDTFTVEYYGSWYGD